MKKLISVLLVIAMMMSTCVVVFSGTVTAFAASSNASDTESFTEVVKTFVLLVKSLNEYFQEQGGFFAIMMDEIYQALEDIGLDIDGIYEWITTSGIEVWIAENIFPLFS